MDIVQGTFRIDGRHKADQTQLLAAGLKLLVRGDLGGARQNPQPGGDGKLAKLHSHQHWNHWKSTGP